MFFPFPAVLPAALPSIFTVAKSLYLCQILGTLYRVPEKWQWVVQKSTLKKSSGTLRRLRRGVPPFGENFLEEKGKPVRRLTGFPKISPQARGVMRQMLPLAAALVEYALMGHPAC